MKHLKEYIVIFLVLLVILVCMPFIMKSEAEAVVEGALQLSEAPFDSLNIQVLRVDVVRAAYDDMIEAEIWVPPEKISDVVLYDGWHFLHARWVMMDDHIVVKWHLDDILALDGTVGIYLLMIEGE